MGKAKVYGLQTKYNPRLHMDMRYQRQQHQRNREKPQRNPVAGKIVKKEAQEDGV